MVFFYNNTKNHFINSFSKKAYPYITFLFWFYPFLHARTSQESLGISFFLISLGVYFQIKDKLNIKKYLLLGFLLSITFVFRYNLGISLLFIIIWDLLFQKKILLKNFLVTY